MANILVEKKDGIGYIWINRPEVRNALNQEIWREVRDAFVAHDKDDEVRRGTVEALNHGSGFITRELGKRMQLRALPKLNFKLDNSIEYSVHISEIIDSLHKNEK